MTHSHGLRPLASERGAALIVAMMVLLLVTILGVGTIKVAIDQERSTGLSRERQELFWLASEAADMEFARIDDCIASLDAQGFDAQRCALQRTLPNKVVATPAGAIQLAADSVVRCNNRNANSIADCRESSFYAKCNRFLNNPNYGLSNQEPDCMVFIVSTRARGPANQGRADTESIYLLIP